ncbi:MAG: response regulator transcription factor [Clostridia bacterium]|nr:response regulator transcription factor [Clostridia bacterium]
MRLAIVEDEAEIRASIAQSVRAWAEKSGAGVEVSAFENGSAFLESPTPFDIVLMDIQMPGMDGLTCARLLREKDEKVQLIFITAMIQYAIQGYKVNALDYLLKPVDPNELDRALTRAVEHLSTSSEPPLTLRSAQGISYVAVADILFAEAVDHAVMVHTLQGAYPASMTLKQVESLLAGKGFFRCHAAYLVNLKKVERITASDAVIGAWNVPVSKHRRREFLQAMAGDWGKAL